MLHLLRPAPPFSGSRALVLVYSVGGCPHGGHDRRSALVGCLASGQPVLAAKGLLVRVAASHSSDTASETACTLVARR